MEEDKHSIIVRFFIVYFIVAALFVKVVVSLVRIQHHEGKQWLALSDSIREINKQRRVEANRGNIYSSDGQLMASTIPQYFLHIDFRAEALRAKNGELFFANIDSLSYCLSRELKDRSAESYKAYLSEGYRQKHNRYPLTKQKISYTTCKKIKSFPLFREGRYRSGLIETEQIKRIKPFGTLAASVIGDVYADKGKGAKNGLEASFNDVLAGKPGLAHNEKKAGVKIQVLDVKPINGQDITTTIDVDMQDIAEKALRKKMVEINAEAGVAVLMETKTGQVKACVNLKRTSQGAYGEVENIALRYQIEPGSTFKVPAIMAALEDGKITPATPIDCGDGTWQFDSRTKISDHNTGARANGVIPASEAIVRSSNVAMAKIIYGGYKDNPQQYVETLRKMGVGAPMDLEFAGEAVATASILGPKEKSNWATPDLVSMGYGYTVYMPLLYTLAFYNAIANDGKMLRPYFVKNISKNGSVVKEFQPEVIRSSIASRTTVNAVKEMMLGVVESKEHSTGRKVKSDIVQIAGKTGTARYNYPSNTKHRVSFCGFFPYDKPQYTCIVFIQNPQGAPSGGEMAGPVFKEIAEKVMANKFAIPIKKMPRDSTRTLLPQVKNGNHDATRFVLEQLKVKTTGDKHAKGWVRAQSDSETIVLSSISITENLTPNVLGMGAKDAVYLLESAGLRVQIAGRGKVVSQSLPPGTKFVKGNSIVLELK